MNAGKAGFDMGGVGFGEAANTGEVMGPVTGVAGSDGMDDMGVDEPGLNKEVGLLGRGWDDALPTREGPEVVACWFR